MEAVKRKKKLPKRKPLDDFQKAVRNARRRARTHNPFVESCAEFLKAKGFLSEKQMDSLSEVTKNYESSYVRHNRDYYMDLDDDFDYGYDASNWGDR